MNQVVVEVEELSEPDTEGFLKLVTDPSHLAPADGRPTHFTHGGRDYHFTHVVDRRRNGAPAVVDELHGPGRVRWELAA